MKIVTYVLAALLVAALGAAAFFYFSTFEPMAADYARMKAGLPELDRAKSELKKYKEKEAREAQVTAWINPSVDELSKGLAEEIQAGKAEVTAAAGQVIVINIAEDKLFTPQSATFAKDSRPLLEKIAGLLANKNLNGKTMTLANSTDAVPAQGKGKKRTPPKEARALAAERSIWLAKFLEQHSINQDALIAAELATKQPDLGFKIRDHKTMITIAAQPVPAAGATQQKPAQPAAPTPAEKSNTTSTAAQSGQPKTIPLKPAQPKTN